MGIGWMGVGRRVEQGVGVGGGGIAGVAAVGDEGGVIKGGCFACGAMRATASAAAAAAAQTL